MNYENSTFAQFKFYVQELVPLDRNYLHILAGAAILALYLLWKIVRRRQFRGYEVVGISLAIAVVAELLDIRDDLIRQSPPDFMDSVKDAVLTVSAPGIVALGQILIQEQSRIRQKFRL